VGDSRATGARAELSWSDATGRGELRVVGLPAGSYEVWIEDAARTDGNRLAAGTLVSRGNGEAVATVAPPILAAKPARAILTAPSSASELLSVPMSP
jgi:hypothetical protein